MQLLVNIDVDDLERAVDFYTRALGLTPGRRLGELGVEMLGASSTIYLLGKRAGTPPFPEAPAHRDYGRHWTPVHLDFVVEDMQAAIDRAVGTGAVLERTGSLAWGRLAVLADPFGHGFCFVQFLGRGYDEIADKRRV